MCASACAKLTERVKDHLFCVLSASKARGFHASAVHLAGHKSLVELAFNAKHVAGLRLLHFTVGARRVVARSRAAAEASRTHSDSLEKTTEQ